MRPSCLVLALMTSATMPAIAAEPQPVKVLALKEAPAVDGNLAEWGKSGWSRIAVKPAVDKNDRAKYGLDGEDKNFAGQIVVELKAGVAKGRLFIAARWADDAADTEHKGWDWSATRYVESKRREDMFAVRFHLDGEYDRSMLAGKSYRVDLWLWSAARTNPLGLAEDVTHNITTAVLDGAAEYAVQGVGTVFIRKLRDAGSPLYKIVRPPREKGGEHLPSIELLNNAAGSVADVSAKGSWKSGFWSLEFSRALNTGNTDDVVFKPGGRQLGQIAVFNRSSDENKSISEPLLFDFSGVGAQ